MALNPKPLANGQLSNVADSVLFTAVVTTIVKMTSYVNTNASPVLVNFGVNITGTTRLRIPKDMALGSHGLMEYDNVMTLEAGDSIRGWANVNNVVDFVIDAAVRP